MSNLVSPAQEFPVIETERLKMRCHRMDDFVDYAAMWADSAVTRYIGGRPLSREESWARLLRQLGHWSLLGFGYWAIEEKASGCFVGEAGFADFKRDIEPAIDAPEMGWVLVPRVHGKGYATEAVHAALAWGEPRFTSTRTVCLIAPENAASTRVAVKCGFRQCRHTSYQGEPVILFDRDKS